MSSILVAQTTDLSGQTQQLMDQMREFLTTRGVDLGLNVLAAIAIFVVGRWVAKLIRGMIIRLMKRAEFDATLVGFLSNILYGLLLTFVVVAAISRLGVDTTSFAAILAAAGLAVGFALRDSLGNFAAGVMLIIFRPFTVGDFVEAGGAQGVVEEVHIFSTILRSGDNVQIIVPNGQIVNSTISNFSAKPTRRIDLVVGCGYQDDLKAVKACLEDLMAADERILADPAPVVAVGELGASSVDFLVRPWVASGDYWAVRWDLTEAVKVGFDERGFNIPYPQQELHVHKVDAS